MLRFPVLRLLIAAFAATPLTAQETFAETDTIRLFERRSELLSAFWGRDMAIRAGVVVPANFTATEQLPICYSIHGFGGSHDSALRRDHGSLMRPHEELWPDGLMARIYREMRASFDAQQK